MITKNDMFFYHIYPLGFCGAEEKNCFSEKVSERLYKISDWIPHMKHLGVNSLYLGPVFESMEHGYDTIDYYKIDKRLGTNESFKNLSKSMHENNISVIVDGVFNHVGREHFAFKDILLNKENSKYKNWISGLRFDKNNCYNDGFTYDTWDGHENLVKLNLKNNRVKEYLLNAVEYWLEEFDIDGIRLDAADVLDFDFMRELTKFCKLKKTNFWIMGEVVHGNYDKWVNKAKLDSVTNYECYKGLYSSHNDCNYFEIAYSLKRQFSENGIYKDMILYNFADNHDTNRVGSSISNKAHLYPLYILLFSIPGIPSLYYGSEWGIEGKKGGYNDHEIRPELKCISKKYDKDLESHITTLSTIRNNELPLRYGNYNEILVNSKFFIFERKYNNEIIVIIVNSSDQKITISSRYLPIGSYIDILNSNEIIDTNNTNKIDIYSCWGRILKKIS